MRNCASGAGTTRNLLPHRQRDQAERADDYAPPRKECEAVAGDVVQKRLHHDHRGNERDHESDRDDAPVIGRHLGAVLLKIISERAHPGPDPPQKPEFPPPPLPPPPRPPKGGARPRIGGKPTPQGLKKWPLRYRPAAARITAAGRNATSTPMTKRRASGSLNMPSAIRHNLAK